jgi:GalNAc-alpha-(1->4)-GalNAc-alpha-(1->3)-diNAcBac-PP-undecaprenol alpha-1,4-N-acetyl-D-galactosaminyltransferase
MIIIHIIDNLNTGGAEKQFREIVNCFDKGEFTMYLFFPCWNKTNELPENLCKIAKDIFVEYKTSKLDIFKIIAKLNKIIRTVNPHIVHSWLYYSNIINTLSYHRNQTKIISQRFGYKFCIEYGFFPFLRQKVIKFIDKKSDLLIVNSLGNYNYLTSQHKYSTKKIHYIPNGITIDSSFIKDNYKLDKTVIKLLHVGNFREEKNHHFFIPFIKKLRKKYSFKLTLIGDGSLRSSFFNKILEERLGEYIDYSGQVNSVFTKIKDYDIFVFPSISEGLPNALMEALAYGLPCVCFDIDGCVDLIKNNDTGFIVQRNNLEDFCAATEKFIENEALRERLGRRAVIFMKQNFSVEKIALQYRNLYVMTKG